jgi:hypothetical protein
MTSGSTMLKAAGLWERTSAKGARYFSGRLGGVKLLILENRDRSGASEPSHYLFIVNGEAQPKQPDGGRRQQPARRRQPYPPETRPVGPDSVPMPDDTVDDLRREGGR